MKFVRSRYLMLSKNTYADANGRRARLAYAARKATLFALDEATAAALEGGEIPELQLDRLRQLTAVVPEGEDELASVLAHLRSGSDDRSIRGFTIIPTNYCNMACDYCGQEHYKSAVDNARLGRLAARVEATIADPATRSVNVTWFGGEPLLALRVIRELSARFAAAAQEHGKDYAAHMATNGSLLTVPTLRLLHHECKLQTVEVTIDGPEEVHNRRRLKRNGTGSYQHIVWVLGEAIREQVAPELRISIRTNVDAENEGTVGELITDLAARGLAVPQIELNPVPVHSWGNDVSAVELAGRHYAELEVGWLRQAQSLGFGFGVIPTALKRTTCRATSVSGEIVDSQERIYSCSEHPLVPGVRETGVVARVSDLAGSQTRPRGMFDDWYDDIDDGTQGCGRCALLPVCGGACPKLWREGHVPCPSMKFNWDERVDILAERLGYKAQL
ncbi:MAG TPA: radical SAM/SPASM domain-containing protein [Micromonosporaceae bacterium]|nr:radical SAM/SPASM domain-containing protein [Micromonosporaceae bacterium]